MSLEKNGSVMLWLNVPALPEKRKNADNSQGKPKKKLFAQGNKDEEQSDDKDSPLDAKMKRLKEKHPQMPDFKIRVWAKMLINGNHDNEDEMPQFPFFTGRKSGRDSRKVASTGDQATATSTKTDNDKMGKREAIIKQLRDLKQLQNDDVLTMGEFKKEKEKLVAQLSEL